MTQQETSKAYQPLFDKLHEHGLILLTSEMDEIIAAALEVNENIGELYRVVCDVTGCNLTAANQGGYWKDSGYWCVCPIHSMLGREGSARPEMKKIAIAREAERKLNKDGYVDAEKFRS